MCAHKCMLAYTNNKKIWRFHCTVLNSKHSYDQMYTVSMFCFSFYVFFSINSLKNRTIFMRQFNGRFRVCESPMCLYFVFAKKNTRPIRLCRKEMENYKKIKGRNKQIEAICHRDNKPRAQIFNKICTILNCNGSVYIRIVTGYDSITQINSMKIKDNS